eukprot:COSAG04_NODE_1056_length_8541_cov_4.364369_2_plen_246_part_00
MLTGPAPCPSLFLPGIRGPHRNPGAWQDMTATEDENARPSTLVCAQQQDNKLSSAETSESSKPFPFVPKVAAAQELRSRQSDSPQPKHVAVSKQLHAVSQKQATVRDRDSPKPRAGRGPTGSCRPSPPMRTGMRWRTRRCVRPATSPGGGGAMRVSPSRADSSVVCVSGLRVVVAVATARLGAQSTEHRAQSTEYRAQSTEHRAQTVGVCTVCAVCVLTALRFEPISGRLVTRAGLHAPPFSRAE